MPGVEEWRDGRYRAAVALEHGPAIVAVGLPDGDALPAVLHLSAEQDESDALARLRRTFDLDLDTGAMTHALSADPVLAPLVAAAPGRRAPGTLDPQAMVLRAVLGQQVSTAAARTHATRLVASLGTPLEDPEGGLTHLFPPAGTLIADPDRLAELLRLPEARKRTVAVVASALASGAVDLERPVEVVRRQLLALPGVGPWTADTVLMRALGHADTFLEGDLGVIAAARALGLPDRPKALAARARDWSPHRSHAVQYLWATLPHAVNSLPVRTPEATPGG